MAPSPPTPAHPQNVSRKQGQRQGLYSARRNPENIIAVYEQMGHRQMPPRCATQVAAICATVMRADTCYGHVYRHVYGYVHGQMYRHGHRHVYGHVHRHVYGRVYGRVYGYVYGQSGKDFN